MTIHDPRPGLLDIAEVISQQLFVITEILGRIEEEMAEIRRIISERENKNLDKSNK